MDPEPELRERFASVSAARALRERLVVEQLQAWLGEPDPSESDLVWEETTFRRRILGICGYAPEDGLALALRPDVDLQDAIALVRRGCDPATATRILL